MSVLNHCIEKTLLCFTRYVTEWCITSVTSSINSFSLVLHTSAM